MNVFTYYEFIPGRNFQGYPEILKLWHQSWRSNGWTPIVIGEAQFRLHPEADAYDARMKLFPTINDARYDLACFRRWLAMATLGGLMTDADVMNRGFRPEHLPFPMHATVLCEHQVPCVVYGTTVQYLEVCHQFSKYQIRPTDLFNGKPLVEDMTILRAVHPVDWFDVSPVCAQYGDHEFKTLVHCSTESTGPKRAEIMKTFL
jgi:hypothetical protein